MKNGDKVVCINDRNLKAPFTLIKGEVYTVGQVIANGEGLLLVDAYNGDRNPEIANFYGHRIYRFRKISEDFIISAIGEVERKSKPKLFDLNCG